MPLNKETEMVIDWIFLWSMFIGISEIDFLGFS